MKIHALLLASAALSSQAAIAQTVPVSPYNANGWSFFDDATRSPCLPTSVCEFVNGPGSVSGSINLALTGSNDRPSFGAMLPQLASKKLSEFTALEYTTYVTSNTNVQAIALQFNVDRDVTDNDLSFQGRLVFEPYWNGQVTRDTWQTWTALSGRWWVSRGSSFSNLCVDGNPCTFAELVQHFPNIGIRNVTTEPNVVLKAGSGWTNFNGNVDKLVIGVGGATTVYDFEKGPSSKEDCKNNGWVGYFKNQGQCVSTFAS